MAVFSVVTADFVTSDAPAASLHEALTSHVMDALGDHARVCELLGSLFVDAGHELALVGGPVRDGLLGRVQAQAEMDLDFTTSADPDTVERLLRSWADAVWTVGKNFGTVGCRFRGTTIEVTTYRSEKYDPSSRKPVVEFGDSLVGDLYRRDFTVNSMAVRLPEWVLVDPHGGLRDLHNRVLATPAPAVQSFDDDPLRMMRAARFVAQLGFSVSDDVLSAIADQADRLNIVSAERVRVELVKLVCGDFARQGVEFLTDSGLAERVLPEVPAMRLEVDEHHRHKDVYEHSLTVMSQAIALESGPDDADVPDAIVGPDFVLRFAALMHDIGKPATRKNTPGGGVSFHHHEVVGAKMTAKRMKALRFDTATLKAVTRLVELHLRFHGYGGSAWTDSAVRRYVTDAGDLLPRLHLLTRADCTTRNKRKAARLAARYDDLERRIGELAEQEQLKAIRPDLDGAQIMEILQIAPGPVVGRAYKHLLGVRMDQGPLGEDEARERLLSWWADQPESRSTE